MKIADNVTQLIGNTGIALAWKTAGYIGADFFLLQWIGTPWGRGRGDKADMT